MYKEIIIALITAFGAVIGSYLANNKNIAVIQTQIEGVKQDISRLSTRGWTSITTLSKEWRTVEQFEQNPRTNE